MKLIFQREKSPSTRINEIHCRRKGFIFPFSFFLFEFNQTLVCIDDTRSNCIVVVEV